MSRRFASAAGCFLSLVCVIAAGSPAAAEDVCASISFRDLRISEERLLEDSLRVQMNGGTIDPRIVLFSEGEAYVHTRNDVVGDAPVPRMRRGVALPPLPRLVLRAAAGSTVEGLIVLPGSTSYSFLFNRDSEPREGTRIRFAVEMPNRETPAGRKAFFEGRLAHNDRLADANIPGGAFFRYQAHRSRSALGYEDKPEIEDGRRRLDWRDQNDMEGSFGLLTGGRAISENLQLHRMLPVVKEDKPTVALASLAGITVREFNWKPLVKNKKPETDALAARIPFDQHAIFFPSFSSMIGLADLADDRGTLILRSIMPQSVNAHVRKRYERQLCLPATAISRLLGPHLVKSVALTGGDPYLMTGADVAVLFQATNVTALRTMIDGRVGMSAAEDAEAQAVSGQIGSVPYTGMVSPDRATCAYVATLGDTVVVTNSLAQLKRLVSVGSGKTRSLASLDEYTFFRDRYSRSDGEEQALAIISDATIRRWCSPKWRIASSRTVRAAAVTADAQAENLDKLVTGSVDAGTVVPYRPLLDAGHLTMGRGGVQSDRYGTLAFHTPIIEQEFTHVTPLEAEFYERWRSGYQSNWSNYFDPIAVRVYTSNEKMSADVTVMPLIDRYAYDRWSAVSVGGKLAEGAGDPHATAIAHWTMALNPESSTLKSYTDVLSLGVMKLNTMGWIGGSMAVYTDEDPFWDDLQKNTDTGIQFLEKNIHRLPVVFQIEVRDPMKLAAFLTGFRALVESSAPELTVWETRKHKGQAYVRVGRTEKKENQYAAGIANLPTNLVLYYAPTEDVLIATLNETLLKRALDRRADRLAAGTKPEKPSVAETKWLGQNVAVHLDRRALELYDFLVWRSERERQMQRLAWANLPVLNEWRRRYPHADPVALHEQHWHLQLACPGGGTYRWNETWQTMESTVYGHPG
jgi:hypothetical protein